jgi:hypothetical protein
MMKFLTISGSFTEPSPLCLIQVKPMILILRGSLQPRPNAHRLRSILTILQRASFAFVAAFLPLVPFVKILITTGTQTPAATANNCVPVQELWVK